MPGSKAILTRTANGSADWEIPTEARGQAITLRAIAKHDTTGAVAGAVAVRQGSTLGGVTYFDDAAVGDGMTLSGTDSSVASMSFESTGNEAIRLALTGISATTTVYVVASW